MMSRFGSNGKSMKNNKCTNCKRNKGFYSKSKKGNKRWHNDSEHDLCYACWRNLRNKMQNEKAKAFHQFKPLEEYLKKCGLIF